MYFIAEYIADGTYDYMTLSGHEHISRLTRKGWQMETLSHIQVTVLDLKYFEDVMVTQPRLLSVIAIHFRGSLQAYVLLVALC